MPKNTPSDTKQNKSSTQFNARLPRLTHNQINNLAVLHGLTKTQVIILGVDRLARDLESESFEANNHVRMLKTVARIAPQIDLGQGE